MHEIKVLKNGLSTRQDQFMSEIMEQLQEGENKVGATEIASTIQSLLKAKTVNNAGIEMTDNKVILDTVKLVLQLNGVKVGSSVNINLFNVSKPGKDENLNY